MSDRSAYGLAAVFVGAGVSHFAKPGFFEAIVPRWFPNPPLTNQVSGVAELALGVGMIPRRTRRFSAIGLLALVAVVFPANIDMAINDVEVRVVDGEATRVESAGTGMRNWLRLPLQLVLAAWIWRHVARDARQAA